jgi:hypothetical protein
VSNSTTLALPPALSPGAPLTAAERGPAWVTAHGCTPWCVMDHEGEAGDPGWHQGPEAIVIAPRPACQAAPGEGPDELMSARVTTINSDPQELGIRSSLWVFYGGDTMELDVDQARQLRDSLSEFLVKLADGIALLVEAQQADRPADPVARAALLAKWDAERVEWFASELGAEIIELDPANKPDALVDVEVGGWYRSDPTPRLYFPKGQTPAERVEVARRIYTSVKHQ